MSIYCSVCGSAEIVRMPAGERYTPDGMVATVELCCTRCGDITKKVADPSDLEKLVAYAEHPDHEDVVWLAPDKKNNPFR